MEKNNCETCGWFEWDGDPEEDTLGKCNRYPTPEGKYRNSWCGEYKIKAKTKIDALPHNVTCQCQRCLNWDSAGKREVS